MTILLRSESDLELFGAKLATALRPGDVIALSGDLGAGKTTLARGVWKALGLDGEAPSPTFAIVQPYEPPEVKLPIWHVDLYRLDDSEDSLELGLDEAREHAALLIEWPERLGPALWDDALRIRIDIVDENTRCLTASIPPAWEGRWPPDPSR